MNLLAGKRWTSWPRLLAVAGTAALLWVVFRRIGENVGEMVF